MSDTNYEPMLTFDRDTPDFAHGVEVGRLWEQMKADEPFHQEFHAANAEMVLRMAEALDVAYRAEILDDVWMVGFFGEGWEKR